MSQAVILGDSIASLATVAPTDWWTQAQNQSGWRFAATQNAGVSGNQTDQMLTRLSTDVLAYHADWVVVEAGGNDIANGISSATITANLAALYSQITAAGSKVIATTVCPSTSFDTAGEQTIYDAVNTWIRAHYSDYAGAVICDWDSAIRTAAAYTWKAGYTSDGVHPNATGAAAMASVLKTTLAGVALP